ncbi:MAG TPA: VOC family protein [Vampirovibrionales bacterium]
MAEVIFHIAFPVKDIQETKNFYINKLGCRAGRETAASLILDFFGHQLVAHKTKKELIPQGSIYPQHFGIIFKTEKDFAEMEDRLVNSEIKFMQEPKTRFEGEVTEHKTMFIEDPFCNIWEFKFYKQAKAIFEDVGDKVGDAEAEN